MCQSIGVCAGPETELTTDQRIRPSMGAHRRNYKNEFDCSFQNGFGVALGHVCLFLPYRMLGL